MVVEANQTISNLQSYLQTAQLEKSDLQSALATLKKKVTEDKQRLSLGLTDFKQWMRKNSVDADKLISVPDPSTSSSDIHHVLAHNALAKVRSENWSSAYEDAEKSLVTRPSAMGYISKALAQIGMGEPEEAMSVFDLAFANCNPKDSSLLLLIKTIIVFMARKCASDTAISRIHDLISVSKDDETMYCCVQVLGKMYLMQGDYARAVQSLERAQGIASSCTGSDLKIISFIFGWTFYGLRITVLRYLCENLYASGRAEEAADTLLKIIDTFGESKVAIDWVTDLKIKCIEKLETLGDTALNSGEYDDAMARYTSALSLDHPNPVNILIKRSKVQASKGLWEGSLKDANEVIKRDPSSHRGYERKYAALHGAEDYGEANNALLRMLSIIESSPDQEVRRLRTNYTASRETIVAIDAAIQEIFSLCPLVLIDVTTGRLCNAQERVQMFKSETQFEKIVSETAMRTIDRAHIRQCVAKYFKWTMFSHTWEGKEPTLKDVNLVDSVWKLDESPLNEKLRQFCTTARDSEDGYRWAWSDTCCIDKDTSAILSQSLTSMYTWYEKAAETLVYLADVLPSAELDDLALTNSRWMTRAWTLQELLASKVVRFYNRDWKLYLNDTHANHKESLEIRKELAKAMGVAPGTITSFQPEDLGVREKLRLASTRDATVEEDIAYSLIGIFSSDIVPRYGLGKTALGHLLESIVARTGDVTVIAWTGQSLPYNSALPASLAVYSQTPYSPPPMEANELHTCVEQLRTRYSLQDALAFYYRFAQHPRATFSNRCLQLPCIAFYVTKIRAVQGLGDGQGTLYRATVSLLGKVEFRTADAMPLKKPRKLVFVHPWLRDLRDPLDGSLSDNEPEAESDVNSSDEAGAESNAGSGDGTDDASEPPSPSHAEPSARVDPFTLALWLIARLGRPFNALLLEQQANDQYKRVAAEHEIIVPGVPYQTNPKDIKAKVVEIV
ncbi:TPR-like protein [Imleria badia]|nr:TPR-like protein [Imleria badia]